MNLGYQYLARTERGGQIDGFLEAPSAAIALQRLKNTGLKPLRVRIDLRHTLHVLLGGGFAPAQVARLYVTLGRRIKNGKPLVEGLASAAEYLTDARLKQAVLRMRQAIQEGQPEYQAMLAAGFPKRDAMVIRSTSEAGRTGDTFINLSQDLTRMAGLRRSVKQVFFLPISMSIFMYIFFYFSLWKIAPATMSFLKQTNLKIRLNAFNQAYFDFAQWFHEHLAVGTVVYASLPIALLLLLRSAAFRRVIDAIPTVHGLSVKSDHATLWNSFALLYDAAIPVRDACLILADAAARKDSHNSFKRLSKRVDAGQPIEEAIQGCGFPKFVIAGVRSAASSGDLVAGLQDLVRNLEEDVISATELLKEKVKIASIIFVALGIVFTAAVSYFPVAGTVLGNV
jgi:type II secretory pathway component PulF